MADPAAILALQEAQQKQASEAVQLRAQQLQPEALPQAPAQAVAKPSWFPSWVKIVLWLLLILVVAVVVVTLLFGTGCKATDTSLLCGISNFGKAVGSVLTTVAKNIWVFLVAGLAVIAGVIGLKNWNNEPSIMEGIMSATIMEEEIMTKDIMSQEIQDVAIQDVAIMDEGVRTASRRRYVSVPSVGTLPGAAIGVGAACGRQG